MVLILVLTVITFLSVQVLEFGSLMRVEAVMAGNQADSIKASYLAQAGISFGLSLIDRKNDPRYKEKIRDLAGPGVTVPAGAGEVSFRVSDEGGKINVNHLAQDGEPDRGRVEVLLGLFDILNRRHEEPIFSYAKAAALIDWVDEDDEVTVLDFILIGDREGAESDYYEDLEPPFPAKNAPFDTRRELLLVRGIDKQVFSGLSRYVTVHGEGKININTAPLTVLQSLDIEIDEVLAQNIIDERLEREFEKIADIKNVGGITEEIFRRIERLITTDESRFFSVEARGRVGEATKLIEAVVHRKDGELEIIYWRVE